MISMTFTGPFCKKLSFFTIATAKTDESIQKNSGLSQGPVHPFGGRLTVRGRETHCEQAVEERRGWASDIMWVALYSILVLLAMLLWIYASQIASASAASCLLR